MATNKTNITAHVVVEFDGEGDNTPNVIVEVDGREDGYNNGKTSFRPGDNAFLLLYVPEGWTCTATYVTAGTLEKFATDEVIDVEDYSVFVDDENATLNYPVGREFEYQWYGNNLGVITQAYGELSIEKRAYDPDNDAYTPPHRIGVAKINYVSLADVYRISNVPATVTKVAALFVVTKNPT